MKRDYFSQKTKNEVFERDKFTCQKCGHKGLSGDLEIHHKKMRVNGGNHDNENLITLCSICHYYAPDDEKDFALYLEEKIDGLILDTFRKSKKSVGKRTKIGLDKRARQGQIVTRAPLGYKIEGKMLVPKDDSYMVQEIFQEFLNTETSLTQLAKKHNLSVNGLKKVLRNQTYLGNVKFDGQTYKGSHNPLISSTLFNHVQNKLKERGVN